MIFRVVMTTAILLLSVQTSPTPKTEKPPANEDLIPVKVATLLVNEGDRSVLLVLRPDQTSPAGEPSESKLLLPLVIGIEEARSIFVVFHQISVPRPLSHDLMKKVIEEYGGSIVSCVITKMERETFFAELRLKRAGRDLTIDCRPSDAIALALRTNAPVFVHRSVMTKHGMDPGKTEKPLKT